MPRRDISRLGKVQGTKNRLLADGSKPRDLRPGAPDPEEAQDPTRTVSVEARNATATALVPNGTQSHDRELALDVLVLLAEGEQLMELSGTVAHPVEL